MTSHNMEDVINQTWLQKHANIADFVIRFPSVWNAYGWSTLKLVLHIVGWQAGKQAQ